MGILNVGESVSGLGTFADAANLLRTILMAGDIKLAHADIATVTNIAGAQLFHAQNRA